MKLSIVVPCYNEAENIPLILERFAQVIEERNIEVILVNNGSNDNSAEVIKELMPLYKFVKTILVPINKGYGYGILQGLKEADGDYIGWTHADMQTDPNDVIKAYEIIKNNESDKIFVKGNRKGRPWIDTIFTAGMSLFETIYFKTPMNDINAQPNIFHKSFVEKWENPPYDFALDLYIYYNAQINNMNIIRFPVLFPMRIHGQSKWNTDGFASKKKFIKRTLEYSKELKRTIKRK